jgi:putative membrane protein insertion efficiency factor
MIRKIASFPIRIYQIWISPCIKPCCRFYPSCSEYALQAISSHGVFKGLIWASWRLLKCHPWSRGGYDPVLPNKENK